MIKEIIEYLYDEEESHYEEFGESQSERPKDHIFLKVKEAKELLEKDRLSIKELEKLLGEQNISLGKYCVFFNKKIEAKQ